jgi:hypothetical protein
MAPLVRLLVVGALALVGFIGASPAHAEVAPLCAPTCAPSRSKRSGQSGDPGATSTTITEPSATTTTQAPLGGDAPSIIRRPGEERDRPANTLGVVVGIVMLVGWIAGGAVMFLRARRRAGSTRP